MRPLVVAIMVLAMDAAWMSGQMKFRCYQPSMAMSVDWVLTGLYAVEEVLGEMTIRVMVDPEALPDVED